MSLAKKMIAGLIFFEFGVLALCPQLPAQSYKNDSASEETLPASQWRQKVAYANRTTYDESQDTAASDENQTTQRSASWSEYRATRNTPSTDYRSSRPAAESQYSVNRSGQSKSQTPYDNYRMAQHSPNAKRAAYGGVAPASYTQQYPAKRQSVRVAQRESPPADSDDDLGVQYEPLAANGPFAGSSDCDSCGGSCGDCGDSCDSCDGGDCGGCGDCQVCCPWLCPWMFGPRTLAIFGGVHGYKGPRDHGENGNFGFQEGFNFGAPLGDPWGCGYQIGFQAMQSNISGYKDTLTDDSSTSDRHQYFATAGIFRRAENCGWQWGVTFDYLFDTYYQESSLKQIRTETGFRLDECNEIGYSGAYGLDTDYVSGTYFGRTLEAKLAATDQFMIYFRRYFENGGDGRIWGGLTGYGDGLFGADFWIPIGGSWSLQNCFNYLIPKQGAGASDANGELSGGQVRESWSVAMNLVWYPGRSSKCIGKSCYRPLLNVADNSLFMVRETTRVSGQ